METTMGAALKKAGYDANEMALLSALSKYLNNGGTIPRLRRLVDIAAEKLSGEGQACVSAQSSQQKGADARQPDDGEGGRRVSANEGRVCGASPAVAEREGEAKSDVLSGRVACAEPSHHIADGNGQRRDASGHSTFAEPVSEPSPSVAGRVLRKQPGSGALLPKAYEMRAAIRGENWLLAYAIPNGPRVLSLRWGDLPALIRRMARQGADAAYAALVLREVHAEGERRGRVSPDQIIEKTLSPAEIDRIAKDLEEKRDKIIPEMRRVIRKTVAEHAAIEGGQDAA